MTSNKGFTLVELIIVMAILGILAGIAVPKYSGIKVTSAVKADAATAASIVQAARIQESDTGVTVTTGDLGASPTTSLDEDYFDPNTVPQTGPKFSISGGGPSPYAVKWTPDSKHSPYTKEQIVTEGQVFTATK
jgi:prepilin-type N-terminal cleavage/methylation domain-containing protein